MNFRGHRETAHARNATPEEVRQGKNWSKKGSWRGYSVGAFAMNQLLQIARFVIGGAGPPAHPQDPHPVGGQGGGNDGGPPALSAYAPVRQPPPPAGTH